MTYPDGETVTYGYDGGGNVISASGTEAYVKNILYNEHGQRTEIDYGNNVVTKYAYDDENLRLKTIETTKGGRTIQSLTYDYDDTGNVTRRSNDGFQTKDDNRKFAEHNYEYDSLNRLVKAKGSYTRSGLIIDNMLQKYDTKYDYTPGGNISKKKQSAWGVGTEGNSITDVNLSYDNEYKYDSPKPHAVTKVGSTEYTYDLDGRMTGSYDSESKFKRTFTWDEEGRLLKTVDNKHTTDYRYDANGERICKYSDLGETIYASGYYTETDGKKISKHIYIGSTRVASQVMSRTCETSTTMKRENTLYYHTDHLGSSGYVTDKKGEFYEHTEYTSSGESWVNEKVTGNANLPYKYCLKEMDNETGLYYYGARYYDAKTSRWISTDPILESYLSGKPSGGVYDPSNLDLYSYVGNNPIKYIDPDGKRKMTAKEIATVRFFIGDGIGKNKIDYSKLKVNYTVENLKQMSYSYKSRKMVFPDVSAQKTEDDKIIAIGIIVHEVNHQFQYESDPKAWSDVIGEQIDKFFGKSDPYVYKNNYPKGITDLSQIKEKEGQCQYVEDFVINYMMGELYEQYSKGAKYEASKEHYSEKSKEYRKKATEQARVLRNYGYESQAITNLLGEKKK